MYPLNNCITLIKVIYGSNWCLEVIAYGHVHITCFCDSYIFLIDQNFICNQVKPLNHSNALPPPGKKGRPYICSCMIYMRPTTGAKLVMKKWIEELQDQPWSKEKKANDQPGFNWALMKTAGEVCSLFFNLLFVNNPNNLEVYCI